MKSIYRVILVLAFVMFYACDTNEVAPVPELSCLEGEFIGLNPACQAFVDGFLIMPMYDIKIINSDTLDTISVVQSELPLPLRVLGQKFFFQVDSIGKLGTCLFLWSSPPPPLRVSNVSVIPCDDESR